MTREEAMQNIKKAIGFSDTLDESIFTLCPELKESEDERIRKAIVELVKRTPSSMFDADTEFNWIGASHDEILAWLEKQKAVKTPQWMIDFLNDIRTASINKKGYDDYDGRREYEGKILAIIKWLEGNPIQQKEQKPRKFKLGDKIHWHDDDTNVTTITGFRNDAYLTDSAYGPILFCDEDNWERIEQKQKPVEWNEEDEKHKSWILECLADGERKMPEYAEDFRAAYKWLKSLKDRGNFPKSNTNSPSEWSEKDEKMRKNIIWVLESYVSHTTCESNPSLTVSYPTYYKEVDWLKSLSSQLHWKPSEEQMQALWEIYQGGEAQAPIASLYDDLKKLMEE